MLDLDAGVHLHEVEVLLVIDQELQRAGVLVFDRVRQLDRGAAHRLAHGGGDEGRRRFLQQLLVAALDGAVALADVDDLAELVGQDLKFDVVRILDQLLKIERAVVEGLLGLHFARS